MQNDVPFCGSDLLVSHGGERHDITVGPPSKEDGRGERQTSREDKES